MTQSDLSQRGVGKRAVLGARIESHGSRPLKWFDPSFSPALQTAAQCWESLSSRSNCVACEFPDCGRYVGVLRSGRPL